MHLYRSGNPLRLTHVVHSYNSKSHPVPFMKASNAMAPPKAAKEAPDLEEAIEEEDAGEADVAEPVEDELDLKNDKYVKQPKKKPARAAKKSSADDGDDAAGKPKGRAKTSTAKGKGKGKK